MTPVVEDRFAVVGDCHRSGALQSPKVREHRALAGMGRSSDREDIHDRAALRLLQPRDPVRRVDHGLRVRHAADRGESSGSSCRSAGGDRFFVALAGFSQVNMQINESGSNDQSTGVEFFMRGTARLARRRNFSHLAVAQQDVHERVDLRSRIDHSPALDQEAVIFSFWIQIAFPTQDHHHRDTEPPRTPPN